MDWNTAKDKMWNGIGWYGFIDVITTSTTDISLVIPLKVINNTSCQGRVYYIRSMTSAFVVQINFKLYIMHKHGK